MCLFVFKESFIFKYRYVCVHMSMGAIGGLKRVSNDLELDLQTIESYWTWMVGTEFRPFAKAALVFSHRAPSLVQDGHF